jgi:hypothetical protein
MRALKGGIPRAFRSHKTPEGAAYRRIVRAWQARFGDVPEHARPLLKAYGVAAVDLDGLSLDLEQARSKARRRDAARIRRQMTILRTQLLRLDERLETLLADQPTDFSRLFSTDEGVRS